MNKFTVLSVACCLAAGISFSSCSDNSALSESSAKKALNKEAAFTKNSLVRSLRTGYYEVDSYELDKLAKLQAAGMVEFKAETIIELKRRSRWNGYWSGGYTYYDEEIEHTYANVTLTPQGQKLVIEKPAVAREDIVKDFKSNEDFVEATPDYLNAVYDASGAPIADVAVEEVVAEEESDSTFVEEVDVAEEVEEEPVVENTGRNSAYENAQARTNYEYVNVLLGQLKVVKCKEVLCSEDMMEAGKGECDFIWKVTDKTPFGYVFDIPAENYLNKGHATFVYYQDLGWTVSSMNLD